MPTMFDSHDEFNEWFSKDIENHAERQSGIDAGNDKNLLQFSTVFRFELHFISDTCVIGLGTFFCRLASLFF